MSAKPKIALFDFAGCEGCQLTVLDCLQKDPNLLEVVEIAQFREAMSEKDPDFQIAFIEGSYTSPSDLARLQRIRQQAEIVIALGACAHLGGINSLRNWQPLESVHHCVYEQKNGTLTLATAQPISAAIPVDATIPGCPIDRKEFIQAIKDLLHGCLPRIPDYPVCVECKLRENACLILQGKICLGPVIRAGCGALCPSFGAGCAGCRGLVSNPNLPWLEAVLTEQSISVGEYKDRETLFLSYQMLENEA